MVLKRSRAWSTFKLDVGDDSCAFSDPVFLVVGSITEGSTGMGDVKF